MIRLIKSAFYREDKVKEELLEFIGSTDRFSFGDQCQKFEKAFAKYHGAKDAIFVNSGSSANLALIQTLLNLGRLKKGDKVGFSALTWSTNVMPMMQLGLEVVPVDVELDTLNVSSEKFLEAIEKTDMKAFFTTNVLGLCDDIDEIMKICEEREIIFLEDNCEALGTVYKGEKLGNFGLAGTFSFFIGHHLSTLEGGMVVTDDEELATMLRLVRAHGWDRNLDKEGQEKLRKEHGVSEFYDKFSFYDLGYNFRPTEINGFLGNAQVHYIDKIAEARDKNFKKLSEAINKDEKFIPLDVNHLEVVSNFAFPVICRSKEIRDEMIEKCEGVIDIRPIIAGDVTKQPFYKKYAPDAMLTSSNSDIIHEQGFYMGNNPDLTDEEIDKMIEVLTGD